MASPMARLQQKTQAAVTTGLAGSTGIPCAMVYGLYRALPGDRAFLPPSSARSTRKLSLSVGRPGPRDFAVRVRHVRLTCLRVHRIPAPRIVTIGRNVPLHRGGMRGSIVLICPTPQALMHAADWHDGQFSHGAHAGSYGEGLGRHRPPRPCSTSSTIGVWPYRVAFATVFALSSPKRWCGRAVPSR
jgi:hypothetical protein